MVSLDDDGIRDLAEGGLWWGRVRLKNDRGKRPREEAWPRKYPLTPATMADASAIPVAVAVVGGGKRDETSRMVLGMMGTVEMNCLW